MNEFKKMDEAKLKKALSWFRDKIKKVASPKKKDVEPDDISNMREVGNKIRNFNLYTLVYNDPKYKEELPFYDAFPLFFPLQIKKGSESLKMDVLNIHYLTPANRKKFMKELETLLKKTADKKDLDPDNLDKFPVSDVERFVGKYMNQVYLKGGGSAGEHIRQSYRSYLFSRIKSRIKKIPLSEWNKAVDVILPRFQKASSNEVYKKIAEDYKKYKSKSRKSIR